MYVLEAKRGWTKSIEIDLNQQEWIETTPDFEHCATTVVFDNAHTAL